LVRDEADALRAATELGGPVVVKPRDADYGQGVTLNLVIPSEIRAAYVRAQKTAERGGVIVERYLRGSSHRLLVVAGRLVAGVRREPAGVVGDGVRTSSELVEQANRDERRGTDGHCPRPMMELDDRQLDLLARSELHAASVPEAGQLIALSGHEIPPEAYVDVTDGIHPETRNLACEAAELVGLDVAGLDLIATDIGRPLRDQQGGFLEINAEPAIAMHLEPHCDRPRPVGESIVRSLFPGRTDGRVPLVVAVGQLRADLVANLTACLLRTAGCHVGSSSPKLTACADRILQPHSATPPDRLRALMLDRRTEAAVLSAPLADLGQAGLGADRCQVLVLADNEDCTDCDLGKPLLRRLMERASRCVLCLDERRWESINVLNCPDLVLVATDAEHPALLRHRDAGGFAAFPLGGVTAVAQGWNVFRHVTDLDWGDGPAIEAPPVARALAVASALALEFTPRSPGVLSMGHTLARPGRAAPSRHRRRVRGRMR
jgi:cyanophycin synthetase